MLSVLLRPIGGVLGVLIGQLVARNMPKVPRHEDLLERVVGGATPARGAMHASLVHGLPPHAGSHCRTAHRPALLWRGVQRTPLLV